MTISKTVAFTRNAANLFFHLLTACNLNCRHCYINPKQHGRETLPLNTVKEWLTLFARRNQRANVIFLGGEPTLHPELAAIVQAARDLGYASITIDTNGYLFHDILDRTTPEIVDFISFSLDGATRETNDAIRGPGVYDTCIAGIRRAVRRGFNTSLIYTVSTANIHELQQMPALLTDLGVRRFFIQVIGIRGQSAAGSTGLQVSRDCWLSVVPQVAARAAAAGIHTTYPKVFLPPAGPFECAGVCADNYFVFPNGRVYRCPLCEDYPIHAFQLEEEKLVARPPLNESDLFHLTIPEGCVMNKLIQPENLSYDREGKPEYQVACCMLKEEVRPGENE